MPLELSRAGIAQLLGNLGPRPPSSLAEAQAAATIGAYLRQAGMSVSVDPFQIPTFPRGLIFEALLALCTLLLTFWLPFPSLLLALWLLCFLLSQALPTLPFPVFGPARHSQNVIGIRPWAKAPPSSLSFFRLVVLAPLDSPPQPSLSAKAHAALTTLLTLPAELKLLPFVELWTVALGATTNTQRGLADLLTRYPFLKRQTLFLVMENPSPSPLKKILSQVFYWKNHSVSAQIAPLALEASAKTSLKAIVPPSKDFSWLTLLLHRSGYAVLNLAPNYFWADSAAETNSGLGQMTQVIRQLAHHLDAEAHRSLPDS